MNEKHAIAILNEAGCDPRLRKAAGRYLQNHPSVRLSPRLIMALRDDDEGVRRAASEALIRLGLKAWPDVLVALMDRQRGSDPRLRRGAYHVLRFSAVEVEAAEPLVHELQGFSRAGSMASVEADRLCRRLATSPDFAARLAMIQTDHTRST